MQNDLLQENSEYWSALCGSRAAKKIGLEAGDPGGVDKFDAWFFNFYPYLLGDQFIPWNSLKGNRVIEIGLGYGSVSRRLGAANGHVVSVDVAPGAVNFARDTAKNCSPVRASALELPFPTDTFDVLVSLGCLHHTGDLAGSLRECLRIVKPSGKLIVMVYNRFSYKRWIVSPVDTMKHLLRERQGEYAEGGRSAPRRVSWFWDRSPTGSAPPHTEFASHAQLQYLLRDTGSVEVVTVNIDSLFKEQIRLSLLNSWLSRRLGLDLYVTVQK